MVSTKSPEYLANPAKYEAVPDLTGDESRAARVTSVDFPVLLKPVDDLPPTTVITHIERKLSKQFIRGTAADNGEIVKVTVNGQPATSLRGNFAEWQIELPDNDQLLESQAEDAAGNKELRPHKVARR